MRPRLFALSLAATGLSCYGCASAAGQPQSGTSARRVATARAQAPEVWVASPESVSAASNRAELEPPKLATPRECAASPESVRWQCFESPEEPGGWYRWRSSLENYLPRVACGRYTEAQQAWLDGVRLRVQREFSSAFLPQLERLDSDHPLNDSSRSVRLEVVVGARSGCLMGVGVLKTSGVTWFDVAVLESVLRALPFARYPQTLEGEAAERIYLHWEFPRNPERECDRECLQGFVGPRM